jgi:uncharacterized protein
MTEVTLPKMTLLKATSSLLKRPILLGGLGLTAGALLLHGLDASMANLGASLGADWGANLGSTAVWGAIAVGSGLWWFKQIGKSSRLEIVPIKQLDRATVDKSFKLAELQIDQLAQELAKLEDDAPAVQSTAQNTAQNTVQNFRQQLASLSQELERKTVRLAVMGGQSVGKTTVARALSAPESLVWVAESTLSVERAEQAEALSTLANADLVLFVTAGDLTDSEFQTLQTLRQQHYRVLVAFNKQDQYLPADRPVILQQLRERLQDWVTAEDLVGVMAQPAALKIRQHQADGTVLERTEQPEPELAALQERLNQVALSPDLVLGTVLRQVQALTVAVQTELNQLRRTRALPIIEQYQWIAAGTAFANPVPTLDLLATATINAQMVVDLGALYQQQFSLEQAKTIMGSLGSQMVKLGLVEMASQAIAPLLKSHALTYVAGGTLQGISAAYLTRLAGLSLVEYFEEHQAEAGTLQMDGLVQKLKAVFQANQRPAFLQNLVKQGVARLIPGAASRASVETANAAVG